MNFQNDLILRAAKGEQVERVPVWMMRQAGRVLTEYKAVRSTFPDFKAFIKHPEASAEVTIQPVDIFGVDAPENDFDTEMFQKGFQVRESVPVGAGMAG